MVERVRATLGADVAVESVRRGEQADLTIVRAGDERFVLKRLSPRHGASNAATLHREVSALRSLAVEQPPPGVRFPRVVADYPQELAYLMTFEPGEPVDRPGTLDEERIASLLVDGLTWFHARTGAIYGDFQPANVLVRDDGAIVLLDPTSPSAIFERVADRIGGDRMAADVGYWVFSESARALKRAVLDRSAARRSAALARCLVGAADERAEAGFRDRVGVAARAHADWLARSQPLKVPVAIAAKRVARSIVTA